MRIWSELGMRYFQLVHDLTNPYDVEVAIKDCDIVINLIGQKPVNRKDEYYEEPNIVIAREIAKICAKKKDNNVKRCTNNIKKYIYYFKKYIYKSLILKSD